jgi:cephalosporin-C deacetylase-like acetyl esterase
MGMTWARQGCLVLVMDQLGHGERRQHPFTASSKSPQSFKVGRQDYYFRYNTSLQLYLIGDSLLGWMVNDLQRGVDLLLSRPGIDKGRIALLGSVAGGGDPAAVTAALDRRITAAVPFNFGGPQPETKFPLPPGAALSFNYAGGGSWESTRNLRRSAADGFMPWVIVGAVAPRGLVYAHEFAWDRDRDPVWRRLEKIYGWYGAGDRLASVHGKGAVTGKPPDSTHCNNIGAIHRVGIHAAFQRWFDLPLPEKEYRNRRPAAELQCLTPEATQELKPRPLFELAGELGRQRTAVASQRLAKLPADQRRQQLRQDWARLLGRIEPVQAPKSFQSGRTVGDGFFLERHLLHVETAQDGPTVVVPVALLLPQKRAAGQRFPVVVAVAQEGKQGFLKQRAAMIAALLREGVAVCLPDVRGTGETRPAGDSRGRTSVSTSLSATDLMLGQTLLGARLSDLRSVLRHLRTHSELDAERVALWGDSFAPVNPADRNLQVPWDAPKLPDQSEPLGGLLALFGGLYEDGVKAVCVRGGLSGYQSLLQSPFLYVPHDAVVPGALTAGDLCDVAAALAPRPLRLEGLIDGLNRRVSEADLAKTYEPTRTVYRSANAAERLSLHGEPTSEEQVAGWLAQALKGR